jgi:hypothetical protein
VLKFPLSRQRYTREREGRGVANLVRPSPDALGVMYTVCAAKERETKEAGIALISGGRKTTSENKDPPDAETKTRSTIPTSDISFVSLDYRVRVESPEKQAALSLTPSISSFNQEELIVS